MPFLSPNQQCQSIEGKISHSIDLLTPSSTEVLQLCLWPLTAPGYLGRGLPCLSSALWCQYPSRAELLKHAKLQSHHHHPNTNMIRYSAFKMHSKTDSLVHCTESNREINKKWKKKIMVSMGKSKNGHRVQCQHVSVYPKCVLPAYIKLSNSIEHILSFDFCILHGRRRRTSTAWRLSYSIRIWFLLAFVLHFPRLKYNTMEKVEKLT